MDITMMKYFLEVAESQHMTASAEKLHIAQPALSKSIHKFQRIMGVPLFEYKGRNIILNEYGEYVRNKLLPVVEQLEKLPEEVQTLAKLRGDTIHLNVLAASALITSAIIQYKSQHENINFRLLQNTEGNLFDVEITTKISNKHTHEINDNQFICTEKIFLAVPNNERFGNRKHITLKEVANEGFISLIGSRQFRYICDRFCNQAEISPKIVFESDNPTAVKNAIAANMGVGFWPEFSWGKIDTDHLRLLEITDPVCSREIVITRNSNKENNQKTEDFFAFLKTYFSEMQKDYSRG